MQSQVFYLALFSYFIGFLFLLLIRSYDKYDKEPISKLIVFSFIGGIIAVLVATFLYLFIHPKFNLTDAILKVGTVEELSKLLSLFVLYRLIKSEFDEIVDGIIYVAAISLGFSVIENIFYAMHAPQPYALLLKRFLFATIGHISFSVYMGIAFYIHKKVHRNYTGLFLAFVLATLAHGFYDGFIFNKDLSMLFLPTYLLLIYFQFRLLKVAYAYSKMKVPFSIDNFKKGIRSHRFSCCNCQQKEMQTYHFDSVKLYICQTCQHTIVPEKEFLQLLKYFRPKLNQKKYVQSLNDLQGKVFLSADQHTIYHSPKRRINAAIDSMEKWLKQENLRDLHIYGRSIEGKIFGQLGFKFLK